jgi:hypothetical protein
LQSTEDGRTESDRGKLTRFEQGKLLEIISGTAIHIQDLYLDFLEDIQIQLPHSRPMEIEVVVQNWGKFRVAVTTRDEHSSQVFANGEDIVFLSKVSTSLCSS